jgi:SAM-dependent methyltransferase
MCNHLFGNHRLNLSDLYKGNYVDATYGGSSGMMKRLNMVLNLPDDKSDNIGRVKRIENFFKDHNHGFPLTLLDIGAGIGVFPAVMKKHGWNVTAIEPDIRTSVFLRNEIGINALDKDFLLLSQSDLGKFSLITFNKVLEHLEDPVLFLSHAGQFLHENGICYFEVPDIKASEESFLREEFFIEHHHIFSISSCEKIADRSGFRILRVERIIEPSGKFTIFAFLIRSNNTYILENEN